MKEILYHSRFCEHLLYLIKILVYLLDQKKKQICINYDNDEPLKGGKSQGDVLE